MADFRFRLEQVIRLRERERDTAAEAYRKAIQAIAELTQQAEALQLDASNQSPIQAAAGQGAVNAQKIIESQRYQMHIQQQIASIQSNIKLIETEREKRRLVLVTREQALKSIEKVKDKQRREWIEDQHRKSQLALDEWSSAQHWRNQSSLKEP